MGADDRLVDGGRAAEIVASKTAGLNNRDYSAQQKVAPEGAVVSYCGNFGTTLPIVRAGPARQNRPPRADVILSWDRIMGRPDSGKIVKSVAVSEDNG